MHSYTLYYYSEMKTKSLRKDFSCKCSKMPSQVLFFCLRNVSRKKVRKRWRGNTKLVPTFSLISWLTYIKRRVGFQKLTYRLWQRWRVVGGLTSWRPVLWSSASTWWLCPYCDLGRGRHCKGSRTWWAGGPSSCWTGQPSCQYWYPANSKIRIRSEKKMKNYVNRSEHSRVIHSTFCNAFYNTYLFYVACFVKLKKM